MWTTGYVNCHDVAVDEPGELVFVNTRFGCLATVSDRYSFEPLWWPPFQSRRGQGDCCHLNGVALADGRPVYVTSVSATSEFDSWRRHRAGGGVVTDVGSGEIVCEGLSMPHSPRLHLGQLWLANAGTGEFGRVDLDRGGFEPITFAPGFLRGLAFTGQYAIVGSSRFREGGLYSGLPLDDALAAAGTEPKLGIFIISLDTGAIVEWLLLEGPMYELFDVIVLPGVRRPSALGLLTNEIEQMVWFDSSVLRRAGDRWLGMSDFELIRLAFDELQPSPGFADWLAAERLSIALTRGNSLSLVGRLQDGSVSLAEYQFGMCRGLFAVSSETLFLATRYQIWRLQNALPDGELTDSGHDRLYLPQTAWTTGMLLVRDLAADQAGEVLFVNGLFSCLSAPSTRLSFEPVWVPPFISALLAEDRCHLSGLATAEGGARGGHEREPHRSSVRLARAATGRRRGALDTDRRDDRRRTLDAVLAGPARWLAVAVRRGLGRAGRDRPARRRHRRGGGVAGLHARAGGDWLACGGRDVVPESRRDVRWPAAVRSPAWRRRERTLWRVRRQPESGAIEHSLLLSGGSSEIHGLALLPGVRNPTAVPFTGADVQELVTVPR